MARVPLLFALFTVVGCARVEHAFDRKTSTTEVTSAPAATPAAAIVVTPFGDPSSPPAAAPRPTAIRVIVAGDLIPHRPALASPAALTSALLPLTPLFEKADGVIANYEAATGELEKKAFRLAYAAPPAWLEAIPSTGIKAITVANNHACDLDYDGVEATLTTASKAGLVTLGGDMKGDPWEPRVVAEQNGKRVCAVAWTTFLMPKAAVHARSVWLLPQKMRKVVSALPPR